MIEIVGVSFKPNGKVYYFSPNGLTIKKGEKVIVETERGLQLGYVEIGNSEIDAKELKSALSLVKKIASKKDYDNHLKNMG